MPMYEYICKDCNTKTTVLTDIYDDPSKPICEKCGNSMERQMGTPAFRLNGKGFYSTDYKTRDTNEK